MRRWLNKEYIIKRKMWTLLLESLIDSFICTILLYFCIAKYNSTIIELLNAISTNNLEITFSKIMFPIILIIISILKLGLYIINNGNVNSNKKKKK